MSIYQITKEYLIKHFDPKCHTCVFDDKHTKALTAEILVFGPNYDGKDFDDKEQIRLAFLDFYIEVAKVAVFFKGREKIIVKTMPYETHPDEHAYIARIGAYVQSIVDELDEVNDKDDILLIPEHHLEAMYLLLHTISIPVDARQLIRRAIHDAFKLSDKDMILFINKKVVIKFYCEETDVGCERRFEGLPQEEIEAIVENLYAEEEDESSLASDIEMVISTLTDTTLNFSKIDNYAYISHHIRLIQNALINFMKSKLSHPEVVIKGVAKYIFREAFVYIHELMAEKLLELLTRENRNAKTFLEFFNGQTIILEGEKFQTPEIIDETGKTWSVQALCAFTAKYAQETARLKKKETDLTDQTKRRVSLLEERKELQTVQTELEEDIQKGHKELEKVKRVGRKIDEDELTEHMDNLERSYAENKNKDAALLEKITQADAKIERDKEQLHRMNSDFEEIAAGYDLLIGAIANVLMMR